MAIKRNEVAAYFHARMATDERFGYSQGDYRFGSSVLETWECQGVKGKFLVGDRDCSSSVIDCWSEALRGSAYEGVLNGATYTGNMRRVFVDSGLFEWHPIWDGYFAKKGDIYLNEHSHTAMCQSDYPDTLSEALTNSFGGIVGDTVGDQTGWEFVTDKAYYDFPWDGILAYNGKADVTEWQRPGNAVNDSGMTYRMHVANLGWLDPVHDGQTAGTTGCALRGEALKITPPEGMVLDVKAHIADYGWVTYSGVKRGVYDPVIGTEGESRRLECLEIDVVDNPQNYKVSYAVHIADFGWTGYIPAGYAAGTVGCSKAIEAIRIKAE